ncbi:MAG: malate synthase A [Planctomycetes bacterium]|nr:malate synthase A [Planctomycetota bacterium]
MQPAARTTTAPLPPGCEPAWSAAALELVGDLARRFAPRVAALLAARREAQAAWDAGALPDFLGDTAEVRRGDWRVAPLPRDLQDRRVEITGPVDRKMIINALNSGANVFMADFEDSLSPTWENVARGQHDLLEAVAGTIRLEAPGKVYQLVDRPAVLMVRPRGWHLPEKHVRVDGEVVPAALVDFGVFFWNNARALVGRGTGPYFYLPKLQDHREAALWDDVFRFAQERVGLPVGTVKATVLIETLPAAFQMDEILHALREHAAGLNCGRWDYIFSTIKTLRAHPDRVLPDRAQVGMTQPFMRAYTQLLVRTCHRRGAFAMGGMAAQIPIKDDPAKNELALGKVGEDKRREVEDGHDGTWVAHPGLVPLARRVFDERLTGPNQLAVLREDVRVAAADLLATPTGTRTEAGLRQNIDVGLRYVESWLRGQGCVPLYHLMEDAATAEISRSQVWQWVRHQARLDQGSLVTPERVEALIAEEVARAERELGPERFGQGRFPAAADLLRRLCLADDLADFLTLPAYELID